MTWFCSCHDMPMEDCPGRISARDPADSPIQIDLKEFEEARRDPKVKQLIKDAEYYLDEFDVNSRRT
jgi:hypothetical protein